MSLAIKAGQAFKWFGHSYAAGDSVDTTGWPQHAITELMIHCPVYVDAPAAVVPDATSSVKGLVQLTGDLGGTAASPTVPGLSSKAASSHTHAESDVTSLTNDLAGKSSTSHTHTAAAVGAAATSHTHAESDVTSLTTDLAGKAASTHTHAESDITSLATDLAARVQVANDIGGTASSPRVSREVVYTMTGTLTVKTGTTRIYFEQTRTIQSVRASVGTAPTGAAVIVDVKKNGTTIFTTQANRPSIAISGFTSGLVTNMDVTSLAAGDYLTVDVAQIGSTVAGSDLTVQIRAV